MRPTSLCFAIALCLFASGAAAQDQTPDPVQERAPVVRAQPTRALRLEVAKLRLRLSSVAKAGSELAAMGRGTMPAGLPRADQTTWPKFTLFLRASGDRVAAQVQTWTLRLNEFERGLKAIDASGDTDALLAATKEMQEMQMSFNLQYLQLQNKISHENRQFTMVSNIMKNKHDTAKNAIDNIR